jgi:hypothetical protein
LGPKRLDLRAMWGLRLDYFGGVRSDEGSVVNLASSDASKHGFWRGGGGGWCWCSGEVCGLAWLAGWLVAIIRLPALMISIFIL